MTHELKRVDEERCADGSYRWRWVCSCKRPRGRGLSKGQWNYQSENVARVAHQQHVERKATGPKVLRDLLKLDGD